MKKLISLFLILSIISALSVYSASAAERLMGDVNGDGFVSVSDDGYPKTHCGFGAYPR